MEIRADSVQEPSSLGVQLPKFVAVYVLTVSGLVKLLSVDLSTVKVSFPDSSCRSSSVRGPTTCFVSVK